MSKKLNIFPNEYVSFDIETTGLSPTNNEIIEIGAVRVKDGKIIEEFNSFIKPTCNIPPFITSLTGINDEMVKNAPCVCEVLKAFIEFIKDDILVAHNANFDISFINNYTRINDIPFNNDYVDTLTIARQKLSFLPNKQLTTLVNYFDIKHRNTHRATDDAIACKEVLEAMKKI